MRPMLNTLGDDGWNLLRAVELVAGPKNATEASIAAAKQAGHLIRVLEGKEACVHGTGVASFKGPLLVTIEGMKSKGAR